MGCLKTTTINGNDRGNSENNGNSYAE